ncbi:ribosome biogenesis protein BRX1 homolog [Xyrauchen texanus]|uniref:ribosome biogenesis protein BRX1 homolog n=1 Tax=Xyrauchen texanus TaxID=154827 RepID=UPI00224286D7|nr:ribosome biogenesis protein BRX1 homolog [Xyrauchen texanus]
MGKWTHKERVLVFSSGGINFRTRHLMQDLKTLVPHSNAERTNCSWLMSQEAAESVHVHRRMIRLAMAAKQKERQMVKEKRKEGQEVMSQTMCLLLQRSRNPFRLISTLQSFR